MVTPGSYTYGANYTQSMKNYKYGQQAKVK
jgi:hypothetical protein